MEAAARQLDEAWRRRSASSRAEAARSAYRAARRHSLMVRVLRVAIPIGAAVSLAAFIVFPFIDPLRGSGVTVGAVRMDGTRITMESPRLAGYRKDMRPYEVTAESATQDIRTPTLIEMSGMRATLVNSDGGVLTVTARKALFNSDQERLQLTQDVRVRTQAGQEADMRAADVDFKAGTVQSREPVDIRLPEMRVSAESLDISGHGDQIVFVGRVRAHVDPPSSQAAPAATPAVAPARAAQARPAP